MGDDSCTEYRQGQETGREVGCRVIDMNAVQVNLYCFT